MIKINLDGGYIIETFDDLNLVLEKITVGKNPTKKNYGRETTTRLGYYSDLKSAIKSYVNRTINERIEATNVEELIKAITSLEQYVQNICEQQKQNRIESEI